jgi:hypothetical protein
VIKFTTGYRCFLSLRAVYFFGVGPEWSNRQVEITKEYVMDKLFSQILFVDRYFEKQNLLDTVIRY